jgi:hypothetical protein
MDRSGFVENHSLLCPQGEGKRELLVNSPSLEDVSLSTGFLAREDRRVPGSGSGLIGVSVTSPSGMPEGMSLLGMFTSKPLLSKLDSPSRQAALD